MPTKQAGKWVRASIATIRQAVANAQTRTIPKFKHPPKGKPTKPASPAPVPPSAASAEDAVAKPQPDEG